MGKELLELVVVAVVALFALVLCEDFECEKTSCLRKCCPAGHFLTNRTCQVTDNKLDFSSLGVDPGARIQDGIVQCEESDTRFLLEKPDNFTITRNRLELENPNFRLSLHYSRYCVDMIDDFTAPKALVCTREADDDVNKSIRVHHSSGNYFI